MMKKLFCIALALVLTFSLSATVFAAEVNQDAAEKTGDTQLSFTAAPTYTVSIPATVELAKDTTDGVKYIGSGTISAEAGLRLEEGKQIEVTLTACDYELDTAASAAYKLPYTVKAGETPIENAITPVAVFTTEANASAQSSVLTFTAEDPVYAGNYSDTVTFTVAVVNPSFKGDQR